MTPSSFSNLQRQIQFTTGDVGAPKVSALAAALTRRGARARAVAQRFTAKSAPALLRDADIVIDGSDDFTTKFAVNDHALRAGLPFVIGSVLRYSGQVFAHPPRLAAGRRGGCYRCLFEAPPAPEEAGPTCADAGVLGAAVAVIAGLVARSVLHLLRLRDVRDAANNNDDEDTLGLLVIDDVRAPARARRVAFGARATCPACVPAPTDFVSLSALQAT